MDNLSDSRFSVAAKNRRGNLVPLALAIGLATLAAVGSDGFRFGVRHSVRQWSRHSRQLAHHIARS